MRSEILRRGGALISAELSPTGVGTVIDKFPQQPSGMTYEGLVVFARNDTEYRVSVRFPETGVTGVRDTLVFSLHMKGISSDADPTEGWMMDPYGATDVIHPCAMARMTSSTTASSPITH